MKMQRVEGTIAREERWIAKPVACDCDIKGREGGREGGRERKTEGGERGRAREHDPRKRRRKGGRRVGV